MENNKTLLLHTVCCIVAHAQKWIYCDLNMRGLKRWLLPLFLFHILEEYKFSVSKGAQVILSGVWAVYLLMSNIVA